QGEEDMTEKTLDRLIDRLENLNISETCDGSLRHTRAYARSRGVSPRALLRLVVHEGELCCDCEVWANTVFADELARGGVCEDCGRRHASIHMHRDHESESAGSQPTAGND